MNRYLKNFFTQCACPEGLLGQFMLKFMNFGHAPLTNWGLNHIDFKEGMTMLDIGCGGGATLKRLIRRCDNAQVYGIDISKESVAKACKVNKALLNKQVFVNQGSVDDLPYDNAKFDMVTAVETVYFWPNLPKCLKEVRRVMKSGGKFVVMIEVVDKESVWTKVVDNMTVYYPEQLKDLFEQAGFINVEVYRKKPSYVTILGVNP